MTRSVSIAAMIEQLDGLRDTNDLTAWEQSFVTNVLHRYLQAGKDTRVLSDKVVEIIERIFRTHFA